MRFRLLAVSALLAASVLAAPAGAHSPFLRPLNFSPSRDTVTVLGGMHEETVFVSDFALRPGDFWVIGPDGSRTKLEGQAALKGVSAVDAPLPAPGTYRITTGDRIGRETTLAKVDGVWRSERAGAGGGGHDGGHREAGEGPPPIDPAAVPAGAPRLT